MLSKSATMLLGLITHQPLNDGYGLMSRKSTN